MESILETITVTQFRRSPNKYIKLAEHGKTFVITKDRKSIMALLSFEEYLAYQVKLASAGFEALLLRQAAFVKKKGR